MPVLSKTRDPSSTGIGERFANVLCMEKDSFCVHTPTHTYGLYTEIIFINILGFELLPVSDSNSDIAQKLHFL